MIKVALGELAKASREKYGDYAYAAGYFENLVASMFGFLPKSEQENILRHLEKATQQMKENV